MRKLSVADREVVCLYVNRGLWMRCHRVIIISYQYLIAGINNGHFRYRIVAYITRDQQQFTSTEVAADWCEIMVLSAAHIAYRYCYFYTLLFVIITVTIRHTFTPAFKVQFFNVFPQILLI